MLLAGLILPLFLDLQGAAERSQIQTIKASNVPKWQQGAQLVKYLKTGMTPEEVNRILDEDDICLKEAEGVHHNQTHCYRGYKIILFYYERKLKDKEYFPPKLDSNGVPID